MKILILYSSVTGNTQFLAKSLKSSEHELTFLPIYPFPKDLDYNIIFLGFWVYHGAPDPRMISLMQQIKGKRIALFGTLSAYPHSEHAKKVLTRAQHYLIDNTILGSFLCLGRLEQKRYQRKFTNPGSKYPMDEERYERLLEGQKHPNQEDCKNFQAFFEKIIKEQNPQ